MGPFWKWHCWQSKGFFPYTQVMCYWSVNLIFKAKLKLRAWRWKASNVAARQPFWRLNLWKSIGFFSYTQVMCYWSLNLIFKAKLKLESGNWKNPIWPPSGHFESDVSEIQQALAHGPKQHACEIWNWNSKANLSYIPESCQLQNPDTEKSNMAASRPFWKWHYWKSTGFFPHTYVICL